MYCIKDKSVAEYIANLNIENSILLKKILKSFAEKKYLEKINKSYITTRWVNSQSVYNENNKKMQNKIFLKPCLF